MAHARDWIVSSVLMSANRLYGECYCRLSVHSAQFLGVEQHSARIVVEGLLNAIPSTVQPTKKKRTDASRPQVGQCKQYLHLGAVVGQIAVARLGVTKLAPDDRKVA